MRFKKLVEHYVKKLNEDSNDKYARWESLSDIELKMEIDKVKKEIKNMERSNFIDEDELQDLDFDVLEMEDILNKRGEKLTSSQRSTELSNYDKLITKNNDPQHKKDLMIEKLKYQYRELNKEINKVSTSSFQDEESLTAILAEQEEIKEQIRELRSN